MMSLRWQGARPSAAVRTALRSVGLAIDEGPDAIPVVHTATATRVPGGGDTAAPWLLVCDAAVPARLAVEATLRGAYDVISLAGSDGLARLATRARELAVPQPEPPPSDTLITNSEPSRHVVAQVARVASASIAVLLTGETGTGKEIMARTIHAWSPRQKRRFVPVTCAAIPNELMEAELFGYARGAFSGAVQGYDGQLMAAEGGTVFLDEIDETPLETQAKLLRVLEDRVVSRLGENVWREVDFRILAATNRDLGALVEAGQFGADLYERLAIVTIHLPPLRERLGDLEPLARHFLARFAREQQRTPVTGIRPEALRALAAYGWPGNIRELRNVLYEALIYKRAGDELLLSDLPARVLRRAAAPASPAVNRDEIARRVRTGRMDLRREVETLERAALDVALELANGNAAEAARLLGSVGRGAARDPGGTVRAMMKRLGRQR